MVFRRNRYVNQQVRELEFNRGRLAPSSLSAYLRCFQWTLEWVEGENYRIRGGLGYVCFRGPEQHNTPIECSEIPQVWRIVPVPGATNTM